jgi:hypothetical protein
LAVAACVVSAQQPRITPTRLSVYQTTLEEPNQKTPEITTEELQKILATRRRHEYLKASSHRFECSHRLFRSELK